MNSVICHIVLFFNKRRFGFIFGVIVLYGALLCFIPKPDLWEKYSFSSAVYDKDDKLLQLTLSLDDKYRLFIPADKIPNEAKQMLLLYEDKMFYYHFGVNPFSILRALYDMATGGRKQGASTISMQVARIVFDIDSSTISGKLKQVLRALQIELFYSKEEILEAYFNLAPYGGNIEGIGAAALIYFGCPALELSLPQIMALTVIPQNPGKRTLLTSLGKEANRIAYNRLKELWLKIYKHPQNRFLDMKLASGVYLPHYAPHFIRMVLRNSAGDVKTTLDKNLHQEVAQILQNYVHENKRLGVYNAAALVVDAQSMNILAYVGSADFFNKDIYGQVDGILALRSPGSALKPFIYALALEKGIIHPLSMLKDVPKSYGAYTPENFDYSFMGLVNATEALTKSRNIPAVDLLFKVKEDNFYDLLQKCGIKKLKSASFYGLAMALGGVEVSMANLGAMYAMLYNRGKFQELRFLKNQKTTSLKLLTPEAAFLTLYMLSQNQFRDYPDFPVSWKTGTSYAYKDAWSLGVAGQYVVAVWVGNFNGEPNHAFVGRDMAAPLMFRLINTLACQKQMLKKLLPDKDLNLAEVDVCNNTGDIANTFCEKKTKSYFIPGVSSIKVSNVTRLIAIDVKTGLRACRHEPTKTVLKSYNFWTSDVLEAYAKAGINIKRPPAFGEDCAYVEPMLAGKAPQIVLPADHSRFLFRSYKINEEKIVLKAITDTDTQHIYWFANNRLAGMTRPEEILEITPVIGQNTVKAVDEMGRVSTVSFDVAIEN